MSGDIRESVPTPDGESRPRDLSDVDTAARDAKRPRERFYVLSREHCRSRQLERDNLEFGPRAAWCLETEQVFTAAGIIRRRLEGAA